ncbi:MAG: hypothetical protein JWO44_549 [Bacteroidetes bacterium]|nr:hypothetical protein [Bacteroidota bacterium]
MKKVVLFAAAVAAISMSSCVKERDCTCTTTNSYAGSSTSSTQTIVYKDVTKKQAKTLCASYTTTDDSGYTTTQDCELK